MTIFKAAACAGLLALALSAQAEITQAATATVVAIDTKASTLTMRVKFQDEAEETQRTVTWDKATEFTAETLIGRPDAPSKPSAIKPGSKVYARVNDRGSNGKTYWLEAVSLLK